MVWIRGRSSAEGDGDDDTTCGAARIRWTRRSSAVMQTLSPPPGSGSAQRVRRQRAWGPRSYHVWGGCMGDSASRAGRPAGRRLRLWLIVVAILVAAAVIWEMWSTRHPQQERELRVIAQERLSQWFPEAMSLPDELEGFIPCSEHFEDGTPPRVIMLHGLDEPGGVFDELAAALDAAGINGWEFRYPNDQAIDHSADLLAGYWPQLPPGPPVVLIGHSMGGLVIRDFVTRWRYPENESQSIGGVEVRGVILVGTPNQGSGWARLRSWLELRELAADIAAGRFSLFAGLRDGTGAARIDLRPDSRFLTDLNARDWPEQVPIQVIGGALMEPTPAMVESLQVLAAEIRDRETARALDRWWEETIQQLGDGVVPEESLELEDAPEPLILHASHRGLLVTMPLQTGPPPAIEPILDTLTKWQVSDPAP